MITQNCSASPEGFHTIANKASNYNVILFSGLSYLLKKIISGASNIPLNHGKSLKAKCKKSRNYCISKLEDS